MGGVTEGDVVGSHSEVHLVANLARGLLLREVVVDVRWHGYRVREGTLYLGGGPKPGGGPGAEAVRAVP